MASGRTTAPALRGVGECLLATVVALVLAIRFGLASAWLLVPIAVTVARGRRLDDLALEPRLTPPSIAFQLVLGLVLLAVYALLHVLFAHGLFGAEITPRLPAGFAGMALHQLLVVAIPEEVFFRGYLQTNLDRALPRPRRQIGRANVGPALVLQAVLFAACHLATGDWTRLRVGAFGLFAGWLRSRSGSVLAPIVAHAVANLWVAILEASIH